MSSAIRLTFAHSGGEVTLISRQHVQMTLPAAYPIEAEAANSAFVAEVRGADGEALHRTAIPNPLESHREVFSEEPGRSIRRVPVEQPEGAFTVIVPDTPEADHLALLMAGPTLAESAGAADAALEGALPAGAPREIARFPLRDPDETEAEPG